jgi:1,2-diacylglycerol 3-alpha-glucosyltransferase
MRIALFSDNFYPEISGISDSIVVLGKELARRGHYVNFYAARYAKNDYIAAGVEPKEINLGDRTNIVRFASLSYATGTGQGRLVIPIGLRTLSIAKFRPDIIHSQLFFGVGIEGLFAAHMLHKPIVGTNHTVLKEYLKYSPLKAQWFTGLALGYMNWYYEHCDVVTAPSQSVLDAMNDAGFKSKTPERIISNPIDNDIFKPATVNKEALKKEFGLAGPVVVYAGRFAAEKKIDVLIKAVAHAVHDGTELTLALAGHGAVQDDLKKLVNDLDITKNVRFMGTLSKEKLAVLYQAAELCATASTSEVQSITMLSSMATGLPLVGVDAPGIAEHIHDNGILAKPDDPASIAEAITAIIKDPVLQKRLSLGAVSYVEAFSARHIAEEWEALYEATIKSYNKD